MTLPTALAAPVEEGMMFDAAERPPRQSLLEGPSTVFCVAVVAWTVVINPSRIPYLSLMTYIVRVRFRYGGRYLGERCKTVGGARGVGDDIVFGFVSIKVDTTDKHGSIGRGSRDDDFLCSTLEMGSCLVLGGEDSRRFDNVLVITY